MTTLRPDADALARRLIGRAQGLAAEPLPVPAPVVARLRRGLLCREFRQPSPRPLHSPWPALAFLVLALAAAALAPAWAPGLVPLGLLLLAHRPRRIDAARHRRQQTLARIAEVIGVDGDVLMAQALALLRLLEQPERLSLAQRLAIEDAFDELAELPADPAARAALSARLAGLLASQ